jgi:protein sidekick
MTLEISRLLKNLGQPQPQYQWLRNGRPVTDFRDIEIYKIPQSFKNDTGSYQCLARNEAGTIFSEKSEVVVACKSLNQCESSCKKFLGYLC